MTIVKNNEEDNENREDNNENVQFSVEPEEKVLIYTAKFMKFYDKKRR